VFHLTSDDAFVLATLQMVLSVLFPVVSPQVSSYSTAAIHVYYRSMIYYPLLLLCHDDVPWQTTIFWYVNTLATCSFFFQRLYLWCELVSALGNQPRTRPHVKKKRRNFPRKPVLRSPLIHKQTDLHPNPISGDIDPNCGCLPSIPYWKYLHLLGDSLATDFMEMLLVNDSLWDLINPVSDIFRLRKDLHPLSRIQSLPFCAYNSELVYDLTRILQTNDLVRFQSVYHFKSSGGKQLIFDTGASITVTPHLEDFVDKAVNSNPDAMGCTMLNGISSSHVIKGIGRIRVLLYTDTGKPRYIETVGYYVPDINVRLLSVQRYLEEHKGENAAFTLNDSGMSFTFPSSIGGGTLSFRYKDSNYLPSAETYASTVVSPNQKSAGERTFTVLEESNVNLTTGQKSLLKLHFRLGHFNLKWIQNLVRHKFLKSDDDLNALKLDATLCLCSACQFAKQRRRPTGAIQHKIVSTHDGNLIKNNLRPGGCISTDQFVSSIPGRLPTSFGKEAAHEMFTGGTVFVDDASGYFHVENQVSLSAAETIRAKHRFERSAIQGGVQILGYRGDNGIYRSRDFSNDLLRLGQSIKFSGVGAHHQNGIAERAIQTISASARAMLIHAMIHWPGEVSLNLWPFAVEYAVYLWNLTPQMRSTRSPSELFFGVTSDHSILNDVKCWGCPAYVLDPTIQDGKKLPRWSPRSKLGQFLGRSREHGNSVGRIRNLKTGAITAQFHVVYDNHFSTVQSDITHDNIPSPPHFHDLMKFSSENFFESSDLLNSRIQSRHRLIDSLPSPSEPRENIPTPSLDVDKLGSDQLKEPAELQSKPYRSSPVREPVLREPVTPPLDSSTLPIDSNLREHTHLREHLPSPAAASPHTNDSSINESSPHPPLRRSSRSTKGRSSIPFSNEFQNDNRSFFASDFYDFHDSLLFESDLNTKQDAMTVQYDVLRHFKRDLDDEDIVHGDHPLAFGARANAEDTPRWHEAMRSEDREGFIEAMKVEMDQLLKMKAFVKVPRQKALDEGKTIIDSTWAFRRKRFPDGSLKKLKARLCVRGDQMTDLNPFDTYSPVVAWSTIRLLLVLSIILDLKTVQVDYTNAFVQAKAAPGTYIEMPRMFEEKGYIYELKRNLYGQRDAPIKFFEHLVEGLGQRGFRQSLNDRCLFMSDNAIVLTYVDDCIFFSKKESHIMRLIDDLRNPKHKKHIPFSLNVESDYEGFLGIDINPSKHVEGALELLQTGLIDRILAALNLDHDNVSERGEPAVATPLGKDENGPPRSEDWSYPSVIGMMLYLASNSRPDIAFAVHQCARFSHCPRACHEKAIKHIARYLKRTRDKGLVMRPDTTLSMEMYADADFAGLWNAEDPGDPVSVKSRTGYLITLSGVPVVWSSKLQTEIATSTMHAEYIALSSGMRELLPVSNVFNDVCEHLKIHRDDSARILKAYEDNEGAQKLASSPIMRVTPHSKHFAIKYHWFREKLDEYRIQILRVATDQQKADVFTKGLVGKEFRYKRFLLMGW
jgi:hypothetical protein